MTCVMLQPWHHHGSPTRRVETRIDIDPCNGVFPGARLVGRQVETRIDRDPVLLVNEGEYKEGPNLGRAYMTVENVYSVAVSDRQVIYKRGYIEFCDATCHTVIVVTTAYRLNIFGFLTLMDGCPGNLGLLDQVAALDWVSTKIAVFGGSSENVCVFGHGAGGSSVGLHVLSPLSAGKFHKALAMSGSALKPGIIKDPEIQEMFANKLGSRTRAIQGRLKGARGYVAIPSHGTRFASDARDNSGSGCLLFLAERHCVT
uniref:(California timema) hypothetical protein n=1 Tax=Timema californicum TaxID=61474 RepID=A0A7R9J841_TIMCA|nr:unnamed protein product [Timema californicum]